MLGVLVNLALSGWEEKITAVVFLTGSDISSSAFRQDTIEKVIKALDQLASFPQTCVRELCFALLLQHREKSC